MVTFVLKAILFTAVLLYTVPTAFAAESAAERCFTIDTNRSGVQPSRQAKADLDRTAAGEVRVARHEVEGAWVGFVEHHANSPRIWCVLLLVREMDGSGRGQGEFAWAQLGGGWVLPGYARVRVRFDESTGRLSWSINGNIRASVRGTLDETKSRLTGDFHGHSRNYIVPFRLQRHDPSAPGTPQ